MRPEAWGALIALALIGLLFIPAALRVRSFTSDRYAQRWGRFEYTITRSGSFVFEGTSFRRENVERLDDVARELLVEWFDGQSEQYPHREDFQCVAVLRGYGAGQAWGR